MGWAKLNCPEAHDGASPFLDDPSAALELFPSEQLTVEAWSSGPVTDGRRAAERLGTYPHLLTRPGLCFNTYR
jgi:hypothetical protein